MNRTRRQLPKQLLGKEGRRILLPNFETSQKLGITTEMTTLSHRTTTYLSSSHTIIYIYIYCVWFVNQMDVLGMRASSGPGEGKDCIYLSIYPSDELARVEFAASSWKYSIFCFLLDASLLFSYCLSNINTDQLYIFSYTTTLPAPSYIYTHNRRITMASPRRGSSSRRGVGASLTFEDFFPTMVAKLGTDGFMKELSKGFGLLVDRNSGVITFESLKKNLTVLGLQGMSDDEVMSMLREGDMDGDGALNEKEFCVLMFRLSPELMKDSKGLLEEAIFDEY